MYIIIFFFFTLTLTLIIVSYYVLLTVNESFAHYPEMKCGLHDDSVH